MVSWARDTPIVALMVKVNGGLMIRLSAYTSKAFDFDLTSAADQPMHDPSSRFVIVFNGEIYNFPELKAELESFSLEFWTKGDTEVVLMAYLIGDNVKNSMAPLFLQYMTN